LKNSNSNEDLNTYLIAVHSNTNSSFFITINTIPVVTEKVFKTEIYLGLTKVLQGEEIML
jgi:hypothetical protein